MKIAIGINCKFCKHGPCKGSCYEIIKKGVKKLKNKLKNHDKRQ